MPVRYGLQPDKLAEDQRKRLADYISRPLGAGKRVSTFTIRSGDRSIESGSKLAQSLRQSLARASSAYRADFTISGNRVGTDNLTGAPLANESGSATLHRGLAKGSNVTPIRVPATRADLPGVPAIITRGSPLLGNRQVLMNFLETRGFGGEADTGSSINTNLIQVDDDCDPSAGNANFSVNDPPPEPPSPPEDRGGSPLEPDDPPPEPVNFDCVNGRCVRSPTGFYDTLPECQAYCQQRYSCVDGDCVPDADGFYNNSTECLNGCRARYECVAGECVRFPTGQFASLQSCVQLCSQPRWDCVSGECTRTDPSGQFATATECADSGCNCTPISWNVVIDAVFAVADPTFGCPAAGNPTPNSNVPVVVLSKSTPTLSQPNQWSAGASVECSPFGSYASITSIFPTAGCQIQVNSFSVTPS